MDLIMDNRTKTAKTIDEYIASFPEDIQTKLQKMRSVIQAAAPEATEKISYQMPTFYLNGNLVHFAAFKRHIGFFPTPSGIEHFMDEVWAYRTSKGTIQFPMDQPIPFDLVDKIVRFRVMENQQKAALKSKC
jgi:uncharacterized protein YdhG (YjbR/CyaY superfamily)